MHPSVFGQFRMEGRGQDRALPHHDGMLVNLGQDLDVVADGLDPRSPDEHCPDRRIQAGDVQFGLERLNLAPESVAGDHGIEHPELYLPGKGDTVISRKGKALDREKFEKMMDEYYTLRGWDVQSGKPTAATLQKLGLEDLT